MGPKRDPMERAPVKRGSGAKPPKGIIDEICWLLNTLSVISGRGAGRACGADAGAGTGTIPGTKLAEYDEFAEVSFVCSEKVNFA